MDIAMYVDCMVDKVCDFERVSYFAHSEQDNIILIFLFVVMCIMGWIGIATQILKSPAKYIISCKPKRGDKVQVMVYMPNAPRLVRVFDGSMPVSCMLTKIAQICNTTNLDVTYKVQGVSFHQKHLTCSEKKRL